MPFDPSRILTTLFAAKLQTTNNPLHQAIHDTITALVGINTQINTQQTAIATTLVNINSPLPYQLKYVAKVAAYTANAGDLVDCTSGTFTVTVPQSAANSNQTIGVINSGSGTITVAASGTDVIGNAGASSVTISAGSSLKFYSSGIGHWRTA